MDEGHRSDQRAERLEPDGGDETGQERQAEDAPLRRLRRHVARVVGAIGAPADGVPEGGRGQQHEHRRVEATGDDLDPMRRAQLDQSQNGCHEEQHAEHVRHPALVGVDEVVAVDREDDLAHDHEYDRDNIRYVHQLLQGHDAENGVDGEPAYAGDPIQRGRHEGAQVAEARPRQDHLGHAGARPHRRDGAQAGHA